MLPEPAPDKELPARSLIVAAPLTTSNPRPPLPVPVLTVTTYEAAAVVLLGATDATEVPLRPGPATKAKSLTPTPSTVLEKVIVYCTVEAFVGLAPVVTIEATVGGTRSIV